MGTFNSRLTDPSGKKLRALAEQMFDRSDDYFEGFLQLAENPRKEILFSLYFILSHSIELKLKAYLLSNLVPEKFWTQRPKDQKPKWHDIKHLYEGCVSQGMPEFPNVKSLMYHINEMNQDFDFRYPTNYKLNMPKPADCIEILSPFIQHIAKVKFRTSLIVVVDLSNEAFLPIENSKNT